MSDASLPPQPQQNLIFSRFLSPTIPAMTFQHFLHLPKEIQIEIYLLAIANIPEVEKVTLRRLYISKPSSWKTVTVSFAHLSIKSPRHHVRVGALPTDPLAGLWNLMETCLLAREVTITWWREEAAEKMQEIEPGLEDRCTKRKLLEVLDEFIDEFQERWRRVKKGQVLAITAGG